jgi:ATP-dependent Clp protease ATP-binding subunit ClpC
VFERFTERSRQVVVLAQDEARALKHNYIGTEHILLGLLREEEGLAARVLESLDITVEEVRAHVARIVGQGDEVTTGQIPFTPRAKKVLELSLREALQLGHNYIGTEHVLLGVVRENEGVASRILLDFGADAETVRNEIIRMLSGPGRRYTEEGEAPAGYSPASPPLAPEFVAELEQVRRDKEEAIEAQQFEKAASSRERERRLLLAASRLERAWRNEEPPEPERPASKPARPADVTARTGRASWRGRARPLPRPVGPMPRRYAEYDDARAWLRPLMVGWLLFGLPLGIGVLLGWLIWA